MDAVFILRATLGIRQLRRPGVVSLGALGSPASAGAFGSVLLVHRSRRRGRRPMLSSVRWTTKGVTADRPTVSSIHHAPITMSIRCPG